MSCLYSEFNCNSTYFKDEVPCREPKNSVARRQCGNSLYMTYIVTCIWPASCEKGPSDNFDAPSKNTGKRQRAIVDVKHFV